jgi:dihydropteroate synthase
VKGTMHPAGLPDQLATLNRCLVMSVINVTPDSFSDGGRYLNVDDAVARGMQQHLAGADLVDVGGESTRPGAERVPVEVELERIVPVVTRLTAAGIPVSIDTMRSDVAQRAIDAGAVLVNDVSGGLADPKMLGAIASMAVPCVLMHWRGHSLEMVSRAVYTGGVVTDVRAELQERLRSAEVADLPLERIVLDPGLGFAKEAEHNWELLGRLDQLLTLGRPLLVGASRKRFLGALLADDDGPRDLADRDDATAAISALAARAGVWCVRVHDARPSADAVKVAAAWGRGAV